MGILSEDISVISTMTTCDQIFDNEQILASAIRFLIDGNNREAAATVFSCAIETIHSEEVTYSNDEVTYSNDYEPTIIIKILFRCPCHTYDQLTVIEDYQGDEEDLTIERSIKKQVERAFEALFPFADFARLNFAAELIEINPNWRQEILEYIKGYKTNNQGTFLKEDKTFTYNTFRYASPGEIEIAKCLTQKKVVFLPNCKAQLFNDNGASIHVYPNFLVCYRAKWVILEVDGNHHYNANSVASDRIRDQSFAIHGIRTWRVDYNDCVKRPADVVNRFLKFLIS